MAKEYRVVCSKECFKEKFYIDIVPAMGVIHEMIDAKRKKINPNISNYGGSIMLVVDEHNQPKVIFPDFNKKSRSSLEYHTSLYAKLEPMIIKTYKNMKAENKDSTLTWRGDEIAFDFFDETRNNKQGREKYMSAKEMRIRDQIERINRNKEKLRQKIERERNSEKPYVPAWLIFQKDHTGD